MKLYYAPGACSLAPHIALAEAGIAAEVIRVDLKSHTLPDGTDYHAVNPKGYVPVLELDDGSRFTEVAVLLQIGPTRQYRRWQAAFHTSGKLPSETELTGARRLMLIATHLVAVIPLPAVFLARGWGG